MKTKELILQSERNRKRLIEIIYKAKAGHIGGDLSCLNVLTALYFDVMNVDAGNPKDNLRDRFILSKGHCVEALYVTLESRGFMAKGILDTLGQYGSILSGHPTIGVPGIEVNTGALGHGLSVGVGIAMAAKMDKRNYKTYVLMGDGEQGEGSIYEAAMAARQYKLDNVLTALYFDVMNVDAGNPKDNLRDRFILSKGHCVEALYVTLESRGFMAKGILDTLGQYGSILSGHPTIGVPGIEVNTGALGHGLSVGVGIAMAAKMDKRNYKTYVLMGDGEQGEGSIYEAAMAARQYKLDNLVAVIDRNHLQISGDTEDVMGIDDIRDRWTAFGWEVKDMNGDDMEDIIRTFRSIDYANHHPHLLVAHTTKGKGVSFMEGVAKWHHGVPNNEQYELAIREISERIKNLEYN